MENRELREPMERVGTLGNTALPPPAERLESVDTLLSRALRDGDEASLATAIDRLRPEMLRVAEGHVRSRDDAEDVVQDAWIAALRSIPRFEGRASLKTWLMRILVYRARTAGRRAARAIPWSQFEGAGPFGGARADTFEPGHLVASGPDPQQALIAGEFMESVERAMRTLPVRQRDVVRLRDLEGWTPAEVCERLQISRGNQRVLLHRGRLEMRDHLTLVRP